LLTGRSEEMGDSDEYTDEEDYDEDYDAEEIAVSLILMLRLTSGCGHRRSTALQQFCQLRTTQKSGGPHHCKTRCP
jgi:hypothetical protein